MPARAGAMPEQNVGVRNTAITRGVAWRKTEKSVWLGRVEGLVFGHSGRSRHHAHSASYVRYEDFTVPVTVAEIKNNVMNCLI